MCPVAAEDMVSDEDDDTSFEVTPVRSSVAGRSSSGRRRTKKDKDAKGGCSKDGSSVVKRSGAGEGYGRDGGECGLVADLVLDLLKVFPRGMG